MSPDGVMLSNGPGDPEEVNVALDMIKGVLGNIPFFGICLGHQLFALSQGAKAFKMKFGHRGANHPVKDLRTGKVDITSQNHGYAIDKDSLENTDLEVTHIALNDGTVEGLRHKTLPAFSVQYHPEARPGPSDSNYLFDEFLDMMRDFKDNKRRVKRMPKRDDIKTILVIGSGPIIIGQAAEFDYAGTQACLALKKKDTVLF